MFESKLTDREKEYNILKKIENINPPIPKHTDSALSNVSPTRAEKECIGLKAHPPSWRHWQCPEYWMFQAAKDGCLDCVRKCVEESTSTFKNDRRLWATQWRITHCFEFQKDLPKQQTFCSTWVKSLCRRLPRGHPVTSHLKHMCRSERMVIWENCTSSRLPKRDANSVSGIT